MQMTFEASSRVTLLFDFWDVQGPVGMVLSVLVVFLLTVLYELLKVWRVWLAAGSQLDPGSRESSPIPPPEQEGGAGLERHLSEASLTPYQPSSRSSLLLHCVQTVLHMVQVVLGYMLMLCVMSYNVWIFLGVVLGSTFGYFAAFPLRRPS